MIRILLYSLAIGIGLVAIYVAANTPIRRRQRFDVYPPLPPRKKPGVRS